MNRIMIRRAAVALLALPGLAGCSGHNVTIVDDSPRLVRQIDDLNYVHGKYFFLQLPGEQLTADSRIDFSTLRVYVDDLNGSNDQGARSGYAEVDPTVAPGASARQVGTFDLRRELADYEVTLAYFGERFPVLVLRNPITPNEILAVSYRDVLPGGGSRQVGDATPCTGAACDSVRLKLLQASHDLLVAQAGNTDYYETDPLLAPFNGTRDYECKGFYDLATTNIDPRYMKLEIRRYDTSLDQPKSAYQEGTALYSYLQILGLDLFRDNGAGSPSPGPDGVVDQFTNASFIDFERGLLVLPDLRPFDPRLPGRADARPEDAYLFKSRIANADPTIPGLRQRVLWPLGAANPPGVEGSTLTPTGLLSNPNVYDKRNLNAAADRRYYIHFALYPSPLIVLGPVAP